MYYPEGSKKPGNAKPNCLPERSSWQAGIQLLLEPRVKKP
jgi:hypothetical protein